MIRRHAIAAWLLGMCMLPRTASAQEPPPASSSTTEVSPPRLQHDPGVTYPEQALREGFRDTVTVDVVVEVDAGGAVSGATVTSPQGHGFDEAALAAAKSLVFEPARRGGKPVAARIRFRYVFDAPPPKLTGRVLRQGSDAPIAGADITVHDASGADLSATTADDGSFTVEKASPGAARVVVHAPSLEPMTTEETLTPGEETNLVLRLAAPAPAVPAGTPAEQVVDVTVHGTRPPREVTTRTLSKEEIDHIPGTNGDALRALQNMPGVARPPVFSNGLIVRGSAPQDTAVFLDGTSIPLIYHFGGLSSVVPTEVLEKIDFFPGNYSSIYGRAMGGIVDVGLRDPKKDQIHGLGQVDLIDTRLMVEGPIGGGWSFLAAGRRSWFDVWLTPILKGSSVGITSAPIYYDYQALIQKDFSSHESFRLTLFGSDDNLAIINSSPSASDPTLGGSLNGHTSFLRVQARYKNDFGDNTSLRAQVAYGFDSVTLGAGARFQKTNTNPLSGRLEFSQKIARGITMNAGFDVLYEPYNLHLRRAPPRRPGQPDLGATDTPVDASNSSSLFMPGAYTEWEITPIPGIRIVPGFRADYDDATKGWDLAPRISAREDLRRDFPRTTLKQGAGLFFQPPTPLETDPQYGQTGLRSNRSVHFDVGVEQEFTRRIDLSVDGFAKALDRLVVAGAHNSGSGSVYGLETLLRYKPDEHFFGWISYTLSRSVRRDLPTDPLRLFRYDQTHVLTMLGSYKLGSGWQLGARFRLISGFLDTSSSYGAFDATAGAQLSVDAYPPYGTRMPLFHQLDLRADKTWTFPAWKLTAYLDVQNVYSHQSSDSLSYNYNFTQSTYARGLPILPSIGLRGEF